LLLRWRCLTDAEVKSIVESGQRDDGNALASDLALSIESAAWPGTRHRKRRMPSHLETSFRRVRTDAEPFVS